MPYLATHCDEKLKKLTVKLNKPQARFVEATQSICGFLAAWQSGKSVALLTKMAKTIVEQGEGAYIWVSPTFDLVRAVLPKMLEILEVFGLIENRDDSWKQMAHEVHCVNGAVVFYRSAEDPEKCQSFTAKLFCIDEAQQNAEKTRRVFEIGQSRVGVERGQVCIAATIPHPSELQSHWLYTDIYLPWKGGDPDIFVVSAKSTDNPRGFSEKVLERMRRTLPEEEYASQYGGEWREGLTPNALLSPSSITEGEERWARLMPHIPKKLHEWAVSQHPSLEAGDIPPWEKEKIDRGEYIDIGVDVAAFGGARNVAAPRWGNIVLTLRDLGAMQPGGTTAGFLVEMADSLRELGYYPRFWVDIPGVGRNVFESLAEQDEEAYAYNPQDKPLDDTARAAGMKAWLGIKLRERLLGEGYWLGETEGEEESVLDEEMEAIPIIPQLHRELISWRYGYDKPGRLRIIDPARSPDYADAYLISLMPLYVAQQTMIQIW